MVELRWIGTVAAAVALIAASTLSLPLDAAQAEPAAPKVTLEFDRPPDFDQKLPDGLFQIGAVEIGYFDASRLVHVDKVERGQLQVQGDKIRVEFPLATLPAGNSRVTLRLRTLSGGAPSDWSAPAGDVTAPTRPRESSPRANSSAGAAPRAPRTQRALTVRDIETRPALDEALKAVLGADGSVESALSSFTRIGDLATAVVISRTHGVSFQRLCAAAKGPPKRSLSRAVRAVGPKFNSKAFRKARTEARQLLEQKAGG